MNKKEIDGLSYEMIGAAIEVHEFLGKGLLEKINPEWLKEELKSRNILFETEK